MSSQSKIRGTRWESAVRDWLTVHGVEVFRPALHGNLDKGDLFGLKGWTLQCRDTARIDLAGAMDDAAKQAVNAKTPYFAAIVKRRRRATEEAYVVLPLQLFSQLLQSGPPPDALGRQ